LLSGLNTTQRRIVAHLLEHGEAKADDLADALNVAGSTIRKNLKELRDRKPPLVTQEGGTTKGAVYRLAEGGG
ncbi:MAG TPA: winged helix-turn-helix transcriptional regulator, partial [Candidatus Sumerlaeota bacterium]|nr:winged helix-turn-helix transcriptional regulator [Candidatus Sumerlaeota bacterium]